MRRLLLIASICASCAAQETLRMNQIQLIGTHNSYHAGLAPGEMAVLRKQNPQAAESLNYKHPKLEAQLDAGVRQLELDVFGDTEGGLFADPLFLRLAAKEGPAAPMPQGWAEAMKKPGFKVMHANDVDFRSHCATFVACLQIVRTWSKAHPGHLPIYLQIENKDGIVRDGFAKPEPITKQTMDALDVEIQSVFDRSEVVTPDDVRGKHATLEEAVLQEGWPPLDWARNKVVFVLDQEKVTPFYTQGHPSLEGRMMFTNGKPGTPDAAFVKMNNPASPEIAALVRKGYLVRTMTDDPQSVRSGDTKRQELAKASGAQILSTDYPFEWKAASGFHVSLPGDKVRCNPVNAPKSCAVKLPY
ncbi:MAG TPA: phosphatidylinositol-specific phospholipase C1-like protein [Candidatus Sulfopaludibacter sp.]|jgi:hypothetical protein|nr:phosphatidylinositol-specific phospholipase C1-like protein [Candidatus Sulfopaludibacter sp.]